MIKLIAERMKISMGKNLNGKELGKNLTQRKDGRYEAKYTDQFGKRHSICGKKLSDVRKRLNEALYKIDHNIYTADCKLTLNAWFDIWTEIYYKHKVKGLTYAHTIGLYNARIRDSRLGCMLLINIRPIHIQDFINGLKKSGLAQGTISAYMSIIRALLQQAVLEGYIVQNPSIGIVIPKTSSKEKGALTQMDQEIFFKYASESPFFKLFKFLLYTGTRINEALALTWEDIDFENRIIKINKTLHHYCGEEKKVLPHNGEGLTGDSTHIEFRTEPPKTKSSIRDIPMSDDCYSLLTGMMEDNRLRIAIVFHNKRIYINDNRVRYNLRNICKQIREEEDKNFPDVTPHTFRHTFATRCIEQGINPKAIQSVLGHAGIDMTLSVYSHVTKQYMTEELSKLNLTI